MKWKTMLLTVKFQCKIKRVNNVKITHIFRLLLFVDVT